MNPDFVNSKEKNYEDLTISDFCVGYMTIIENEIEKTNVYRTAQIRELIYLSTRFRWKCFLHYHGACHLEIERGDILSKLIHYNFCKVLLISQVYLW